MKIGIISLFNESHNCGGLLQAFALCYTIKKLGYEAEQIRYDYWFLERELEEPAIVSPSKEHIGKRIYRKIRDLGILQTVQAIYDKVEDILSDTIKKREYQNDARAFVIFRMAIPQSCAVYNFKSISVVPAFYDAVITGSDQVWNWAFWKEWKSIVGNSPSDAFLLNFVPDGKIKIAYAASISCPEIPTDLQEYFFNSVRRLDALSIRESSSLELFPPDLRKRITPVLDPTLLMNKNDWCKALNLPASRKHRKPYIFLYLLGPCHEDRVAVRRIADLLGLPVITRPNIIQLTRSKDALDSNLADVEDYRMGPKEFVHYIRDAELVLTNSFHAAVFSMNFHTPFYVFQRTSKVSMQSRMESLASDYDLAERFLSYDFSDDVVRPYDRIDWEKVDRILGEKRRQSMTFLENALSLVTPKKEG